MSARRRGPVGLAIRAALTTPALSLFALLIVAATAFVGAAAPGLLQQAQTQSLRYALADVDPTLRDVTATTRGVPDTGNGGIRHVRVAALADDLKPLWGFAFGTLSDAREQMDAAAKRVLGEPELVVTFDMSEADPADVTPIHPRGEFILAFDPFFEEKVTWVGGDKPRRSSDGPMEVGATQAVADAMAWEVGDVRRLEYSGDILKDVMLTGIYEPVDASDGYWSHLPISLQPGMRPDGLAPPIYSGRLFGAPEELAGMDGVSRIVSTTAWYPLKVDAVEAAEARDTLTGIRAFSAAPVLLSVTAANFFYDGLSFGTSSTLTMENALVRIDSTTAIVALIAGGPLAVALVVLALTSRMLALRRRPSIMLAAARGASIRLLSGLLAVEGLVIGALGAAGGAAAGLAVGGGRGAVVFLVPAVIALTPVVVLPVLGLLLSRRRVRADLGATSRTIARWRLAAELAVLVLAGVAVGLVLAGARSSAGAGVDPLLTLVPLLLAGVGCVLTLRLVPLALAAIERGVPGRRSLLALVGPARARRDPEIRVAPVLAVVVGVAISVFSVAFMTTIDVGIRAAARETAGADLRVQAAYMNQGQLNDLADVDGVASTAPVYADEQREADLPNGTLRILVYVIDVDELRDVQNDPQTAIPLPGGLTAGGATGPVPVIASQRLADRDGAETMTVAGELVDILATAPSETPLGSATSWIAVDRSQASRLVATEFTPSVALVDLEPGADLAAVTEAVHEIAGASSIVTTPEGIAEVRSSDPALTGVQTALLVAIGVVTVLLALAIGMTLVLGAPARGRLLALLGALGFRRSRELPIVLWEVVPAVAVALPVGVGVGLLLPFIVIPAIDLTGFIGGESQPDVQLGGFAPVFVAAGFLVVTTIAVLVAALVARRVTAARTLRSIDEEG